MVNYLIDTAATRMRVNADALAMVVALIMISLFVPVAILLGGGA